MDRTRAIFLKQKAARFCILDGKLYWKEPGGVLLNCVNEQGAKNLIEEFHVGECGVHHYWKATMNKIIRAGFYWPTIFLTPIRRWFPAISVIFFREERSCFLYI